MKRRYVYLNVISTIVALILPCLFLKFGNYTEARFTSVPENATIVPKFPYLVPSFFELEKYLIDFSRNYSYFASLYEIGRTKPKGNRDGLPIYNLVLSSAFAKPIVIFIGGIYASDLKSPLTLIQSLTEFTTNIKILAQILPLYDYHFIPLVNPEGYEFVYQKLRKGETFIWSKNMQGFRKGKAVNILNNFDNHFDEYPTTENDEHYGGDEPFSILESMIIRDYILEIKEHIAAVYLFFSSPKDDAITYPYAHTMDKADSWMLQEQLADHAVRLAKNVPYNSLAVVSAAEFGGLQGGRMDDWLVDTLRKSIVLNIQFNYVLRPTDNFESLKNFDTKVKSLLKQLVLSSYREKYLKHQTRTIGSHEDSYNFTWKKIFLE